MAGSEVSERVHTAADMVTPVLALMLLAVGGLRGAAVSDLQIFGKSIHRDKSLLSSNQGRQPLDKQPHPQTKSEVSRSLDLESFNTHVTPTARKISVPLITRLFPPTPPPLHMHANMPMRFGRESDPTDIKDPNSTPNMPQRFGRSWEVFRVCAECSDARGAEGPAVLQRASPFWSLLGSLANAHLLNNGLQWTEDFDFSSSSEDVEI